MTTPPPTVLLVDDQEEILALAKRALARDGFEVSTASSGEAAIERVKAGDVQVIFSDFQMPGLTGEEVLRHARQAAPDACVNIVTGHATLEGAVSCMRLGACDYIAKPLDVRELTGMARRCLRHYDQRREMRRLSAVVTEMEAVARMKSEFLANTSHELRTPLFSMSAAIELLFSKAPAAERENLERIVLDNLDRLTRVVGNLQRFSQMESGTLKPVFQPVELVGVLRKALDDIQPLFRRRRIACAPPVAPPGLGPVDADPGQILEVFSNLLGNAAKFTPEGGQVGVRVQEDGEALLVCVWDTGPGVPAEHRERVFDRFYQVDGSSTRAAGGIGLGLAIVKAIVELHRGRVWVEGGPAGGAEFYVALPRRGVGPRTRPTS